jgi:hypothetical protein
MSAIKEKSDQVSAVGPSSLPGPAVKLKKRVRRRSRSAGKTRKMIVPFFQPSMMAVK